LLRLFRILRVLKLARALVQGEMRWVYAPEFELFMSAVIALNAVVMSLELDFDWGGWSLVENAFLVIYVLELAARIKSSGCSYWIDRNNLLWNYLDFVIVAVGVVDLWLTPAIALFQTEVLGAEDGVEMDSNGIISLLRLMRLFRILRLVKLVKTIQPLYRLLLGVIDSLKAMQWVMLLTILMLYGGAIFWRSLVGKGLIYMGSQAPDGPSEHFRSVPSALFSLFRLMNGDTEVAETTCTTTAGKLLFVAFMVVANWAILAILTSVVSDNMIASSSKVLEEEAEKEAERKHQLRIGRLRALFREVDTDCSGAISSQEWDALLMDKGLLHELSDAAALDRRDLQELFNCIAIQPRRNHTRPPSKYFSDDEGDITARSQGGRLRNTDARIMHYDAFIEELQDEARPADKRAVLRLLSRVQELENRVDARFDEMWGAIGGLPVSGGAPLSP